jgi:hypothetical protein
MSHFFNKSIFLSRSSTTRANCRSISRRNVGDPIRSVTSFARTKKSRSARRSRKFKPLRIRHHHIRRIIIHPLLPAKNPKQLILRQRKLSRLLRQQRIQNLKLRLNCHPRPIRPHRRKMRHPVNHLHLHSISIWTIFDKIKC